MILCRTSSITSVFTDWTVSNNRVLCKMRSCFIAVMWMIQIGELALALHFVKSGRVLVHKDTLQNLLLACKVICVLTVCMLCVWGAKIQAPGRTIGVAVSAGRGEITSTGGAHRCSGAGTHQQREELGEGTADVGADTGMQWLWRLCMFLINTFRNATQRQIHHW